MMRLRRFTVTSGHIKLLQHAYVGWNPFDYGAPSIDAKRPYGEGDVEDDIARILGWPVEFETDGADDDLLTKDQRARAASLHREMEDVLQICLATLSFKPGTYEETRPYDVHSWRLLDSPPTGTNQSAN